MPHLINPTEMYLKTILEMQEDHVPERRVRIAERLGQSGPTVTKTVLRMERDGLVSFSEESKKLAFTATGFQKALSVMRKHRLAECFLYRVVGLEWTELHDEACRLEHVMSDKVADLLDSLLGHPTRTPYGNLIPPAHTERWDPLGDDPEVVNLVRFLHGTDTQIEAQVAWIGESLQSSPPLLRHLYEAGVAPGAPSVFSLHGPSVLLDRGPSLGALELRHQVAGSLFVRVPSVGATPTGSRESGRQRTARIKRHRALSSQLVSSMP